MVLIEVGPIAGTTWRPWGCYSRSDCCWSPPVSRSLGDVAGSKRLMGVRMRTATEPVAEADRVVMPWGSGVDEFLVRGLVRCGACSRLMVAVRHLHGQRAYSCGPVCPQPDVAARPLEQDLLLRALVRAYVTLYGVGRPRLDPGILDVRGRSGDQEHPRSTGGTRSDPVPSAEEVHRWQWCDVSDRRAVLHTAYTCVIVDTGGEPRPVWRHEIDTIPGGVAGDQ